ncbi:MAG: hypothetical protein A3K61_02210 [Thaumarchaeota archaeon RBG_16_49_8]|nr:MAG: hypothetical protein A3K61_02210 [Thaumarchaeota archaeon RBG_16_49_8]
MDETTFRILDALSREIGAPLSIRELTKKIQYLHGTAHYPNIYERLQTLTRDGVTLVTKLGKSSITALNFENYLITDWLAEMELRKKRDFLRDRAELQMPLAEIEDYCNDTVLTRSLCIVNPEKNMKLNRLELLFLLHNPSVQDRIGIARNMQALQAKRNMKIDYLLLNKEEFIALLKSEERNPLNEMLSNKIAIFSPQRFWLEIKDALSRGIRLKFSEETNPAKITEQDMAYNLARFGYKEIGLEIKEGEKICVEYIVVSILLQNENARHVEAIPVILAKNRPNYGLLIFLSQKYSLSGRVLGLLEALNNVKPAEEVEETIKILKSTNTRTVKTNLESIRKKMRLYNAAE